MRKLYRKYMGNPQNRTATAGRTSFSINACTGMAQLAAGLVFLSPWYIANALYYLLLCAARGQALKHFRRSAGIENNKERYDSAFTVYRRSGIFVCLLGVSYFCICLWMFTTGEFRVQKDMILVLGVAAVAFTKIGFAVHGLIVNRHMHDPILSLFKTISFLDAMVSIVVTQCTLLTMTEAEAAVNSSAVFGMGVSILFFIMGTAMLLKKKKHPALRQEKPVRSISKIKFAYDIRIDRKRLTENKEKEQI